jgi:pyruvate dehydrogenase complex dehydrogenase (E1) component
LADLLGDLERAGTTLLRWPCREPLTGLAQPGLASFEPAYADELAVLLRWAFEEIQREEGQSVYFRLSTRPIDQPRRTIEPNLAEAIIAGAYWLREPGPGAELAIAYCGAVAPEALAAHQAVAEDIPGAVSRQPVGCRLTGQGQPRAWDRLSEP